MKTLQYEDWISISIPDNWVNQDKKDLLTFYNNNGFGSLQISCYRANNRNRITEVDKQIREITKKFISGKNLNPTSLDIKYRHRNNTHISEFDYIDEINTYWRIWHFLGSEKLLFITYNCKKEYKGEERKIVNEIISSIKFI